MIPKCGWCGVRIYPWTRNVFRTMFGMAHSECWIERNQSVRQIADLANHADSLDRRAT